MPPSSAPVLAPADRLAARRHPASTAGMRQLGNDELTLTQSSALASIVRRGPMTLGELAASESVAPPTVTKAVADLEDLRVVSREIDPTTAGSPA